MGANDAAIKEALKKLRLNKEQQKAKDDAAIKKAHVTIKVFGVGGGGNSVLKRIAESENFFVTRAVDNFQRVKKCPVERVIFRGVCGLQNFSAVAQDKFQSVGLVLHDQNEIVDERNVVGVTASARKILRRRGQSRVKFDVAA